MRISETCSCGGSLTVEYTNHDRAQQWIATWRDVHPCPPRQTRDTTGTTAASIGMGFTNRVDRPIDATKTSTVRSNL